MMDRLWQKVIGGLTPADWAAARVQANRLSDRDFERVLEEGERLEREHGLERQAACFVALGRLALPDAAPNPRQFSGRPATVGGLLTLRRRRKTPPGAGKRIWRVRARERRAARRVVNCKPRNAEAA